MAERVTIGLVDDHRVVLAALEALLEIEPGFEVVFRCSHAAGLIDLVREHRPDVVICDLEMPGPDPLERAAESIGHSPDTRILVLTAHPTDAHVKRAVELGVQGFMSKSSEPEELLDAIRRVAAGERVIAPALDELVARMTQAAAGTATLSRREVEVVRLAAQGMTANEIAASLHRAPKTIENHLQSAMGKLGMRNRVDLVRWAFREGLAHP